MEKDKHTDKLLLIEIKSDKLNIYTGYGDFYDTIKIENTVYNKYHRDGNFLGFYDWLIDSDNKLHAVQFDDKSQLPEGLLKSKFIEFDKEYIGIYKINLLEISIKDEDNSILQTLGDSNIYTNSNSFVFVMDLYEHMKSEFLSSTKHLEVEDLGDISCK